MKLATICVIGFLSLASTASATVVAAVQTTDNIYGGFSGSVNSGDTGILATLNWHSAVFGNPFTINLTAPNNTITDVVFSNGADALEFDGFFSGNAAVGTSCVSNANTACVVASGAFQDLTPVLSGMGISICCGGSSISVLAADAAPEPATFGLFGLSLAAAAIVRRCRS